MHSILTELAMQYGNSHLRFFRFTIRMTYDIVEIGKRNCE